MILAACIDDSLGMSFNRRRQSRDSAVYADLAAYAASSPIYMDSRSAHLFEGLNANIICRPDYAESAGKGEFCFTEFISPGPYETKIEKLILYRWNRRYPSDVKFDIDLSQWQLEFTVDFPGSSHEKITKEVYIRE